MGVAEEAAEAAHPSDVAAGEAEEAYANHVDDDVDDDDGDGGRPWRTRVAKTTSSPRGSAGRNAAPSGNRPILIKPNIGRVCYLHTRPFFRHKNFSLARRKGENRECDGGYDLVTPPLPRHTLEKFL